jgi:hypothetical protein
MPARPKYVANADGKFACDFPGCDQPPYDMPQHLGLHRWHKHGIKGSDRPPRRTKPSKDAPPLTADQICAAVLAEMAPNGSIPISALSAYQRWVESTREFMVILLG